VSQFESAGDPPVHYPPRLHVVLYQPEIPPNTGAIGRTCVAIGAKLWLVKPLGFQLTTKTLRRAGLDYWKYLHWETVTNWEELQQKLPTERYWFFTKRGQTSYSQVSYREGDVLVFGSESRGLPPSLLEAYSSTCLKIPMREEVRSINLSCSVAVASYEAVRQFGAVAE
jgi:tRNA (cytidine/uridine-2'-O-)-methyltransferase